ncbi:uncharacterized protein RJT20DRAFT_125995 [Scheffersomyces xylosifermentans]|uniref:uncharacterized protein n=1 Tax=Scheffersomyces xylosifermentans TaxID=1304137 RepID=UPI00315C9C32
MSKSVFVQSDTKKRLASDVVGQLEEDLENDPLDYAKWTKLIKHVLAKDKEEQVRAVYTKYLALFKFDGEQWSSYINYELNRGEFQKVEALFHQCFSITDSVEVCRLYVSYVRRVNDVITGGEKARGTVIQAFEFAVNKVGIDINSTGLWNDYLEFLKTWTPGASWEQQQKVDLIRKVYKKFLVIPTESLETSWSQYTKWENDVNPATAAKFISEKSAEFMLARSWNTEWQNLTEKKIKRDIFPYSANGDKANLVKNQIEYWLKWIQMEKKNILELKDETQLEKRIAYAYRQSTFALPFVPELWFKFSKFLSRTNEEANINRCIDLLSDGLALNPKSLLLSFQLAELYEKDSGFEKAKEIYNNLAKTLTNDHTKVTEQVSAIKARLNIDSDGDNIENGNSENANVNDDDEMEVEEKKIRQLTTEEKNVLLKLTQQEQDLVKAVTLVYVRFMIASKRAEGIKEARSIFKQAKKFVKIGHQLYVENALLEHFADYKKVALRIFDLGMKIYGTDGNFLLAYLNYLISINDVDNIRILIQTSDTNLSKDIASLTEAVQLSQLSDFEKEQKEKEIELKKGYLKVLFKRYISYASKYLSLDVAQSFANKFEQIFPDDDPIELFSDRYRLGSEDMIAKYELGVADPEEAEPRSKKRKVSHQRTDSVEEIKENNRRGEFFSTPQPQEEEQQKSFVGPTITTLLSALPNASYFGPASESVFNSEKLITLFSNLPNIPVD